MRVGNTLSESGTVSRGVCETDAKRYLVGVTERTKMMRVEGKVSYMGEDEKWVAIDDNTPVSMNMWGFTPDYFKYSESAFVEFLKKDINTPKSEFFIPFVVNELLESGKITVKVLDTTAKWFGVTYSSDRPAVVEKLAELHNMGEYPQQLW